MSRQYLTLEDLLVYKEEAQLKDELGWEAFRVENEGTPHAQWVADPVFSPGEFEYPALYSGPNSLYPRKLEPYTYLPLVEMLLKSVVPKWPLRKLMKILRKYKSALPTFVISKAWNPSGYQETLCVYHKRDASSTEEHLKEKFLEKALAEYQSKLSSEQVEILHMLRVNTSIDRKLLIQRFNSLCASSGTSLIEIEA